MQPVDDLFIAGEKMHPAQLLQFKAEDLHDIKWVRNLTHVKINEWTLKLTERMNLLGLNPDFTMTTRGSIQNGLFTGPKNIDTSWNEGSQIPRSIFSEVIEIDLMIIFSKEFPFLPWSSQTRSLIQNTFTEGAKVPNLYLDHIYNEPEIIDALAKGSIACGGELTWRNKKNEWGDDSIVHYYYAYEALDFENQVGIEWEIGVYLEPQSPVENYWSSIFTPEEIQHQSMIREALKLGKADYKDTIWQIKMEQCYECARRIVAGHAIHSLLQENKSFPECNFFVESKALPEIFSILKPDVTIVEPHIQEWINGTTGTRPWQKVTSELYSWPNGSKDIIRDVNPNLLLMPACPIWVKHARKICDYFVKSKTRSHLE